MPTNTLESQRIPLAIIRRKNKYSDRFRDLLDEILAQKVCELGDGTFTEMDWCDCIRKASDLLLVDQWQEPSLERTNQALDDYEAGRTQPLQEFINALPC